MFQEVRRLAKTAGIAFLDRATTVFNSWLLERGFVGLQQDKTIFQGQ
ncbi:hypothetical protein [Nostoc sp. LEGE 12450]|nr:hypothetical protein [Nostoc sp. LEGE 12450]MBE8988857.1 hypothetical protein [Nostoc sp. LEGE 12450]